MQDKSIAIYVATHKETYYPPLSHLIPIHVGKALTDLDLGILCDNTGDNISEKNPSYCELTALYWMWKNAKQDFLGLFHYRRYLGYKENGYFIVPNDEILGKILKDKKTIILPQTYTYPQEVKNMLNHYVKEHCGRDWFLTKAIVAYCYPDYMDAFERAENQTSSFFCNMFVAHRDFVDRYCEWLFTILFKLEKIVEIDDYDDYQKRIFGFLAERLFNVFIEKHRAEYDIVIHRVVNVVPV